MPDDNIIAHCEFLFPTWSVFLLICELLSCCPDAAQGFCDELEEAVRAQLGIDIWTGAGI
jgi:hypothetical protein